MSRAQRFVCWIFRRYAKDIEADSRAWKLVCSCGAKVSYWDIGGVRWKAKGNPRVFRSCDGCGKKTWQRAEWLP